MMFCARRRYASVYGARLERPAVEIEIVLFEAERFGPCHVTPGL